MICDEVTHDLTSASSVSSVVASREHLETGPCRQQPLDPIQNLRGDACFRLQRQRFHAFRPDDRDGVGIDIEPGIGPRDVVGHDQIGMLLLALFGGARHDVLRLGREPDEQRSLFLTHAVEDRDRRGCRASGAARA